MAEDRLQAAEQLLREVVYRSRERQSAQSSVPFSATGGTGGPGRCGLGERAEADLDLSPRGRELFDSLFGRADHVELLQHVNPVMEAWVERQDGIDRKRNHFLKDFRARHGFDRNRYSAQIQAEFDSGLESIGAEEKAALRASAERLIAATT